MRPDKSVLPPARCLKRGWAMSYWTCMSPGARCAARMTMGTDSSRKEDEWCPLAMASGTLFAAGG
jgi:hypothetical protein